MIGVIARCFYEESYLAARACAGVFELGALNLLGYVPTSFLKQAA
jgi:hypothetical protein